MTASTTFILGIGVLALGGTIALEIADRHEQAPTPPPAHRPVPAAAIPRPLPSQTDLADHFNTVLGRPLFSPDRRPIGATNHDVAGLSRLTGIVVAGGRKIAIFAGSGSGSPVVAEEGGHINAFEVTSITDSEVTVTGPHGATVVRPIFDPSAPMARPIPVVPQAGVPQRKN